MSPKSQTCAQSNEATDIKMIVQAARPQMTGRRNSRVFPILALLFVLALPTSLFGQSTSDLIRQALQTYQNGNLTGAIDTLRLALKADPADPYAKLYLGLLLYEKDTKSVEAQQLLEASADRFPDNVEVQIKLMDSYLAHGEKTKGLSQWRRLVPAAAKDDQLASQLAYLLIRYGLPDAAREQTDSMAARLVPPAGQAPDPGRPNRRLGELHFLRGLIAATQERKTEALALLQQADQQDFPPRDSYQMLILADCLFQLHENRLASQAYQEYLKHYPEDLDARMKMGLAYYTVGALDPAQSAFEQVRATDPRYPDVNFQLAEILFAKNNIEEAEKLLREELGNNPKCGPCLAKLARISHQRGETEQADKLLEEARELAPDWAETHLVAGLVANRKGNYEKAIKELQFVLAKLPDFPTAHLQLSIAYARAGQADKAKEHRDIYNGLIQKQKDAISAGVKDERKPSP